MKVGLPTQDLQNCMFRLFVPPLDILAVFADPEEWAELSQLPMYNLLLKSVIKHCNDCTSNCEELDGIPCCNAFVSLYLQLSLFHRVSL